MKRCLALILGLMILVISVPAHAVSFTFDQACGFIDSTKIDDQIVFTNKTYGPVGESSPIRSLPHDTKGGLVIIWEVDYPLGLLSLFKPDSYDGAVWDFEYDTSDANIKGKIKSLLKLLVTVLQDYIDYENGACTTIYLDTVDIKESLPILQYSPAFTSPNNEIILGPRMTEAEQILVKALLGKRGIQERCHKSCLRIR